MIVSIIFDVYFSSTDKVDIGAIFGFPFMIGLIILSIGFGCCCCRPCGWTSKEMAEVKDAYETQQDERSERQYNKQSTRNAQNNQNAYQPQQPSAST